MDKGGRQNEEEFMLALVVHSIADRAVSRCLERDLMWGEWKLCMIIDTGSPVSGVPKSVYKKHHRWWPTLEKTSLQLSCFLGSLPVAGKLSMDVKFGVTTVSSTLVAVDCRGPLLCSWCTIVEFYTRPVSLLDAKSAMSVNSVQVDMQVRMLLDTFLQLFDNKLGCCKGPPVKLYIKEDA